MCNAKGVVLLLTTLACVYGCATCQTGQTTQTDQSPTGQITEEQRKAEELKRKETPTALQKVDEDRKAEEKKAPEDAPKAEGQPVEPASSDEIMVTISIHPEFQSNGRVVICGETNLPQGTELMISLQEQGTPRVYQSKCSVADGGRFRSESFGPKDSPLPEGAYIADVVMPITRLQPVAVQRVVGKNGEKLSGPLIVRNPLGVSAQSYTTAFPVGENSVISPQAQSEEHPPARDLSTPVGKWYEGGTLHRMTALDWQNASSANKLATCADFVTGMWQKGNLKPSITRTISAVDDFRPYAQQLVDFLDAAFKPSPDPEENRRLFANQTVAGFAAMGMVTMGWTK